MIRQGDARYVRIKGGSCQACITSPPYWQQRRYGNNIAEIGQGPLKDYIQAMVEVGYNIWNALDDRGVWWLNLGDKAAGSGGAGGDHNRGGMHYDIPKYGSNSGLAGIPDGQWCDVPGRVLHALQDEGWYCRAYITWDKGKIRRGDYDFGHTKRPGLASEKILMLTKHPTDYRFYWNTLKSRMFPDLGDVWHFPTNRDTKDNFAPFPDELVQRCLVLSTMPGDRVLDPFAGSGTTGRVARSMQRRATEIDLYAPGR